jgi:hypothetical protein
MMMMMTTTTMKQRKFVVLIRIWTLISRGSRKFEWRNVRLGVRRIISGPNTLHSLLHSNNRHVVTWYCTKNAFLGVYINVRTEVTCFVIFLQISWPTSRDHCRFLSPQAADPQDWHLTFTSSLNNWSFRLNDWRNNHRSPVDQSQHFTRTFN